MNNKVIGIISYLPDDKKIRNIRMKKLLRLLHSCNDIFNLPIIIIAQNYNEDDLKQIKQINNISIYEFVKLGIVGARNALRNIFLNSPYSYLIMLDDDCSISGTKEAGQKYLSQIDENPNCYYEFNKSLLKLFAISKIMFNKIAFDEECNPELGQGFEDRLFYNSLLKLYPNQHYKFKACGIYETSINSNDSNSSWYKNQDLNVMLQKTQTKIDTLN